MIESRLDVNEKQEWADMRQRVEEGGNDGADVHEANALGESFEKRYVTGGLGTSGSHNLHARLAPSHSKTWATCTAALAYCEANKHLIPEDTGSIYAAEGTEAHDHAATFF